MTRPLPPIPPADTPAKVLTLDQLLRQRNKARADGLTVVQCHGCFDIVHPGHIRHLRYAKAQGDILLVTITGDAGVGKGMGRPLIPEELRAENLASLDCVDWVHVNPEPTADRLLAAVKPDTYVKGKEYEQNNDPRFAAERASVERAGGRVVFSSGDVVFSSTALIASLESSVDPFHSRLAELGSRDELSGPALYGLVTGFRSRRIVVVGETILDTYVLCDRPSVAGESPVMTLRPLERRRYDGGAAVVARHAAAMGAKPILVTPLPKGDEARLLRQRLAAEGVDVRGIEVDTPLAEKQRFLVGVQKVMKLDLVTPVVLDAKQRDEFIALAAEAAREGGGADACALVDFGLGLFTPTLLSRLCRAVRPHARVLTGDVSGTRSGLLGMKQMDLLTPSESEAREALGMYDEGLGAVTWRLLEATKSRAALMTMGAEGAVIFERLDGADPKDTRWQTRLRSEHVPAFMPHAADALGCGDALLTAATLVLAAGGSRLAAAYIGSAAAAVEGQKIGNIPVTSHDLRQAIARIHAAHLAFAGAETVEAIPRVRRAPAALLQAS